MKKAAQCMQNRFARLEWFGAIGIATVLSACGGDQLITHDVDSGDPIHPPMIVAHRGGAADAPENTLEAIGLAVRNRADAIWITVQLSKDDVPVLYRSARLSHQTGMAGTVADYTADELAQMNAGRNFKDKDGRNPYLSHPVGIPTLLDALRTIPRGLPIMLDMKALPAERQASAVARVLTEEGAWSRVTIYSTEAAYQQAFAAYPEAKLFESRDATRNRLVKALLGEGCENAPAVPVWTAFELHRKLTVTERFTLGEGRSDAHATMWTPRTVACFRQDAPVRILAIGVNEAKDYRTVACLGVDAVLTDSPATLMKIRHEVGPIADRDTGCGTPATR
nr:glycerophosphodiester phosphodiesterase family protein [Burkholderia cenocepacia]